MANVTPHEKAMQMSLDEYIKLNKGNLPIDKTQPCYSSPTEDVAHKRFIQDEDVNINDDIELNDYDEDELLNCDDIDDNDKETVTDIAYTEVKVKETFKPKIGNKPNNINIDNRTAKIPSLMDLDLTGPKEYQAPLATRRPSSKQQLGQQNQKNFQRTNLQRGYNNKNKGRKKKFPQKQNKFNQNNHRPSQQKSNNSGNCSKPPVSNRTHLGNPNNLYITVGYNTGSSKKTVQFNGSNSKLGSSSSLEPYSSISQSFQSVNNYSMNSAGPDRQYALGLSNMSLATPSQYTAVANRLLELFNNQPRQFTHKPFYDMRIQKEIHDLQRKPLIYKQGTEVISSDGPGINNLKLTPSTTGITMNCRFST